MRGVLWLFSFILCGCKSEGNTQLQSHFWQYSALNGTSSTEWFHNVHSMFDGVSGRNALTKQDSSSKQGNKLIASHLKSVLPPFAVTEGSEKCKSHSQTFLVHLSKMRLWALKMYDASGKIPSGLLNGNINQFGDFDQCLSINERKLDIKGKYCLAYLQVQPREMDLGDETYQAFKLMQSHFMFKSKLTDPGHRVPRFSTMNWGLCTPSSCSSQDIESQLRTTLEKYTNGTGFNIEVRIDPEMCQVYKPFEVSASFFIVSCIFLLIICITIAATIKDILVPEDNQNIFWSVVHCFSLKRNGNALVNLSRSSDDIQSVHGIRMINALMLVLSHKSMALFFMPYSNRTSMVEKLSQPWCIIARTASLYTDSFVMISGLLTSYSFLKSLKKNSKLDLKDEYFSRLIRIVPPLAAIILLSTFILPELGSGPQWNLTVSHHADKCRKTWWKNFLFIHNYLGFENMCLTHTHHLGIDTQLFLISPFLIVLLYKWPLYGISGLVGLAAVSTMARFQATFEKSLSFFIYPGISVSQMFDTANHSYIIPFHRLTAYIIGILLGYVLRHYGKDYKIKSIFLRIGWTITFSFLSYILTKASEMNHSNYSYNNQDAAVYAALAPIACCLFWAWLIFVSEINRGGLIGKFLSSKYCLIWTRISYAVYLTQFPVFFFNVGLQRYSQQYSFFLLVSVLEYGCVFLSSVVLTLLVDMPFGNMKKLIIAR